MPPAVSQPCNAGPAALRRGGGHFGGRFAGHSNLSRITSSLARFLPLRMFSYSARVFTFSSSCSETSTPCITSISTFICGTPEYGWPVPFAEPVKNNAWEKAGLYLFACRWMHSKRWSWRVICPIIAVENVCICSRWLGCVVATFSMLNCWAAPLARIWSLELVLPLCSRRESKKRQGPGLAYCRPRWVTKMPVGTSVACCSRHSP
jgi:hypothetical protein